MAVLNAGFELGVTGATLATADPGDGDAWDSVSAGAGDTTKVYDATHAMFGAQAAKLQTVTSAGASLTWGPSAKVGTLTDHYGRLYLYLSGYPSISLLLGRALSGASVAASFGVGSTGLVFVNDSGNVTRLVGAVPATLNQWIRVEYHIAHSVSAGVVEAKLFNTATSTTPSETITGAGAFSTLASADTIRFGLVSAVANMPALWVDQIQAGAAAYPGVHPTPGGNHQALTGVGA